MDLQVNLATVEQKEEFLDFLKRRRNRVVSINNLRHLRSYTGFIQDNSSVNRRACIRELNLTFISLSQPVELSAYDDILLNISDTYGFQNTKPEIDPDPSIETWHNTQGEDAYGYNGAGLTGPATGNPVLPGVDNTPYSETDGVDDYWETMALRDWITRFDNQAGMTVWIRDVSAGSVIGCVNGDRGSRFELNVTSDDKLEVLVRDTGGRFIHVVTDVAFDFTDWVFVTMNFVNPNTVELIVGDKATSTFQVRSLTTIETDTLETFERFDIPVTLAARSFTDHNRGYPYLNWQTFDMARDQYLAGHIWKPAFHPRALTLEEAYSLWELS